MKAVLHRHHSPGASSLDAESDSGTDEWDSSDEEKQRQGRVRQTTGEEDEAIFERVIRQGDEDDVDYDSDETGATADVEDVNDLMEEEEEEEEEEGQDVESFALVASYLSEAQQQPSREGDVWEETRSYGGGSRAGGAGSSGGGGGGSGGAGGWSAFENVGTKALQRRAGTGNGGKKGKGWRAAELPVEIISRILTILGDRLVGEAFPGTPQHITRRSVLGHSHRWTLAYLQARNGLIQLRLVGKSWRAAVETLRFWETLIFTFFGRIQPAKLLGTITLTNASAWMQGICVVCCVSGFPRPTKVAYPAVPSQHGRIAVCYNHSEQSCSRCLVGPSSLRNPSHEDNAKGVQRCAAGEEDWFGEEDVSSCRDCRMEALQYALIQRDALPLDTEDDEDPARDVWYDYIVMGEGDAGATALEMVERRWLDDQTKFGDLLKHAAISRKLGRPKKSVGEEMAMRRMYQGYDEDEDMEETFEDDAFEDDEYDTEDDEMLDKGDLVQVADMALKDWMNQRILEGLWISPGEQRILSGGGRRRDGRTPSHGLPPAFNVAQPLVPYTRPTPSNRPHLPVVFYHPLPPDEGPLTAGADFVYGSSLREILAPALEQLVRLASFTKDPIKTASSWSTNDVVAFLRRSGAWIPGGLDFLAPELILMERRSSVSSRSSLSSSNGSGRGETPPSLLQAARGPPPHPPPSVPSHEARRDQSPFIGPQPPADLVGGDVPSPMHSISSSHCHSPSSSTTNASISTPPSSTSPPTLSLSHPPPSPRKPTIGLPPTNPPLPRSTTGTKTLPGVAPSSLPTKRAAPPPPPPAQLARPIFPIPCIPAEDFVFQYQTQSTIDQAWFDAWEPLRRCRCGICLRGMGYPNGPANGGGGGAGERNGNGKRKETSGGGEGRERGAGAGGGGEREWADVLSVTPEQLLALKEKPPGELEEQGFMLMEDGTVVRIAPQGGGGLGVERPKNASSDDDGSVKRARTDTA
ncbi:hypothetical protein BDY24DRAFT_92156 [Mrakia frigida]|uniref:uncharacterized protein n=1 Tax=Mrakia frigida TaxID=29902 RepID=UPI003FCC0CA3